MIVQTEEIARVYKLFMNSVGTDDITQDDLDWNSNLDLEDHAHRCMLLGIPNLLEFDE